MAAVISAGGCTTLWGFEDATLAPDASLDAKAGDAAADGAPDPDASLPVQPPAFIDISAGKTGVVHPSAVIDTVGGKLLVAVDRESNPNPGLVRCNLDGGGCTFIDIAVNGEDASGVGYGSTPSAAIDAVNGKLLIVVTKLTADPLHRGELALYRCNLDGGACAYADISVGAGGFSGTDPVTLVDTENKKLLVVATNSNNFGHPSLTRCALDGTGCTVRDLYPDGGSTTGLGPTAAIDAPRHKLVVVTFNTSGPSSRPTLFACNLDGTGCVTADLAKGDAGVLSSLTVANGNAFVATQNYWHDPVLLFCRADGTNCAFVDPGGGRDTSNNSSSVVDTANGKLLVATRSDHDSGSSTAGLFRCNLDAGACSFLDISDGHDLAIDSRPSAALDSANRKLFVVSITSSDTLGLYLVDLR
jgi:hypothetical protein